MRMYGITHAVIIYICLYPRTIEEMQYLCYGWVYVNGVYQLHVIFINFLMNRDLRM